LGEAAKAILEFIQKGSVGNLFEEWFENIWNNETTVEDASDVNNNTEEAEKPQFPVPEIDWETGEPKSKGDWEKPLNPDANWTKPKPSKEYLRPDLKHKEPIGPHTDWRDPSGKTWRIFPDNKVIPKK
jgi:hypothetical protein